MILVIAIAFGTINVVGGFLVTDRMLEMFKSKPKAASAQDADPDRSAPAPPEPAVGDAAPDSGGRDGERGGS